MVKFELNVIKQCVRGIPRSFAIKISPMAALLNTIKIVRTVIIEIIFVSPWVVVLYTTISRLVRCKLTMNVCGPRGLFAVHQNFKPWHMCSTNHDGTNNGGAYKIFWV